MLCLKLGQRKLLFSELEYFNSFARDDICVVYAGAAPGIHSTFFGKYFPRWEFHFYDTNAFSEDLKEYSNIHTYTQYFENTDAERWATSGAPFIFLSDIRTAETDESISFDMTLQRGWVEILSRSKYFRGAMLKFRLPWRAGQTDYFDGKIYTQPRIGPTSTETRLWVQPGAKIVSWDHNEYADRCFFFQRHQRVAFHQIQNFDQIRVPGLDHCHDCWSEIEIVRKFLGVDDPAKITECMLEISAHSKSSLDISPHNMLVNETDIHRRMMLLKSVTEKYIAAVGEKRSDNAALGKKK